MKKVAFITGSAQGIGKSIALELAKNNYTIILNDLIEDKNSKLTLSQIKKCSPKSDIYYFDISDPEQVELNCNKIIKKFSRIDVLVNNAGITRDKSFVKLTFEDWDKVIKVNLYGPFLISKRILPVMIENKAGHIINISSIVGQIGNFGQSNYSAAKAGLIGLTKSLAKETSRYNITVNAIAPGFTETNMTKDIPKDIMQNKILPKIALGRLAKPEEIAKLVSFLASDDSNYITGECIGINGGWL